MLFIVDSVKLHLTALKEGNIQRVTLCQKNREHITVALQLRCDCGLHILKSLIRKSDLGNVC